MTSVDSLLDVINEVYVAGAAQVNPQLPAGESDPGILLAKSSLAKTAGEDMETVLEFFSPGKLGEAFKICNWSLEREVQVLINIYEDSDVPAALRMSARKEIRSLMLQSLGMNGMLSDTELTLIAPEGQSLTVRRKGLVAQTHETEKLLEASALTSDRVSDLESKVEDNYVEDSQVDSDDSRIGGFSRKPTDAREFESERTPDERAHEHFRDAKHGRPPGDDTTGGGQRPDCAGARAGQVGSESGEFGPGSEALSSDDPESYSEAIQEGRVAREGGEPAERGDGES